MKHMILRVCVRMKPVVLALFCSMMLSGVSGQLVLWDPNGLSNFGPSPFTPTSADPNLTVTGLTRGATLTTNPMAAANTWGANGFTGEANDDFTWTITPNAGYQVSFTQINWRHRISSSGPTSAQLQYAFNSDPYTTINTFTLSSTSGANITFALSSVPALQNVPAGTLIKFRILPGTAGTSGGNLYVTTGGTTGLRLTGTVTPMAVPCNAPAGLAAANVTSSTADLSWGTVSGATGYQYVVDQNAADPAGAGTATGGTTFSPTGLTPSTTYYLHVRTDCGSSNFSPWTTIPFTTTVAPCTAPTGLTAANVTHESADLSWNTQAGATYEYVLDQTSTDPAGAGTPTAATTYSATGLNELTTYYLHVRTDCGGGNYSPWTTIPFTTLITPCDAPTGLTAANVTHESADLSWNTQAGATYEYVLDQTSTDPAGAGTTTAATTYSATGLNELTTYYLHVRTDCGGGNYSPWTTIPFTTLITPCDAPTGLTAANVTHESADLSWNTQAGATYEYVLDQTSADPAGAGTTTAATTYNATGLNELTTYYLHVRTDCGGGNYSPWTTIPFTTLITPCDAPTGLTAANVTHESADLSWNTQAGATYEYVLDQVSADPSGAGTTTAATTYNATGLNELTTYYLHVRTDCGGGNYSPWTTIPFTTLITPCDAPTGLTAANVTHESADLSWNTQAGATYEYVLDQVSADPSGAGTPTAATTYSATGLSELTTYYLHVRTDCGGGNYSPWTTIPFTTLITPCDAPTGLTAANVTHESADLSWAAQAGATYEYVLDQVSADPSGAGTPTAATTYSATGLSELTTYYLHVRTDCGGGNFSPWTTIPFTTLITPCDAPTGLTAANVTHESADLSWNTQAGATYEYVLDQVSADPSGAGTTTAATTYSATGLNELTTYYLHVRTDCGGGNYSPWTTIPFTTLITPCDAPTGLTAANVTHESADLSWNTQAGATYEYVLDQVSADPSGAGTPTAATTYSATGLSELTTYYLHVRTDCGGGNYSPWTTIAFTTLITPCDAPTGLTAANVTHESADLSWNTQAGATYEYVLDQVSAAPSGAGTTTAATTYNATGLNELTTYYLHVRTDCGGGNFSPWTTIPFTTPMAPCADPSGLGAANITTTSADLFWNAMSGIDGYEYVVNQSSSDPAGAGTDSGTNAVAVGTLLPNTTYYLHVRVDCGGNFSGWVTVPFTTLSDVGLEEAETLAFEVYPNPATDHLTVATAQEGGRIALMDVNGKVLLTQELNKTATIALSELESGIYLVIYENNAGAVVRRIVKE